MREEHKGGERSSKRTKKTSISPFKYLCSLSFSLCSFFLHILTSSQFSDLLHQSSSLSTAISRTDRLSITPVNGVQTTKVEPNLTLQHFKENSKLLLVQLRTLKFLQSYPILCISSLLLQVSIHPVRSSLNTV